MKRWNRQLIIVLSLLLGLPGVAVAEWQNSSNYGMNESQVGAMGDFRGASGGYSFQPSIDDGGSSLGESAVGNSSSSNYQTNSGFNTTAQPGLTLCVGTAGTSCANITGSSIDFGTLSVGSATTKTAKVSIRNYTSYGYVLTIIGSTPSYAGHNLTAMTTTMCPGDTWGCASSAGTEQFGLNMVYNTSPVNPVPNSADPVQYPSGSFSYGQAGDHTLGGTVYGSDRPYTVNGRYRYVSGETMASAARSSGETVYTPTFLANIGTTTPAGKYSGALEFVVTGTY